MKTFPPFHQRTNANRRGFSLVEIVIALSIVAFAFLSIVGLLGVGLASDQNSTQQTTGTNIAAAIISDLQSTQNIGGNATLYLYSPRFNISLPVPSPGSVIVVPPNPLTGPTPTQVYFDNQGGKTTQDSTTDPATFLAYVSVAPILLLSSASNTNGNTVYMAHINVVWPAQLPQNTPAVGNVELVTQFQLHSN
jgi:prepilin-type N-terminal cleavage/methylation domain-containing protein